MTHAAYRPPPHWPRNLFDGKTRPPADDVPILMAMAHEMREGDDAERFRLDAWDYVAGAVESAFQHYREGVLPLEALEVTATLTAIARPKNYGCRPIWEVGLALGAVQPEGGKAGQASSERSNEAAAGARIALLGAGGSVRLAVDYARPIVYQNRRISLPWEAMCSAFDAIGAGSFTALERLGAVADQAGDCAGLLWLDEVAGRVAGETARAEKRAAVLDRLLASGVLSKNAVKLATVVRIGRRELNAKEAEHRDAWLRMGVAVQKASAPEKERPQDDTDWEQIREEMPEDEDVRSICARRAERRMERELYGPFYWGVGDVADEVLHAVGGMLHYALLGFRQLYALELLGQALPRLGQALGGGELPGSVN